MKKTVLHSISSKIVTFIYVFGLCILILISCQSKSSKKDYIAYVRDVTNGLHHVKTMGNIHFDLQYQPSTYRYLGISDTSCLYDSLSHFKLTLSSKDGQDLLKSLSRDKESYFQNIYYFSYSFQNHIYIESKGQKQSCALYHFERSYNLKQSKTFVFAFAEKQIADKTIVINSPLLDTGAVKFKISKKAIQSIPKVDIELPKSDDEHKV